MMRLSETYPRQSYQPRERSPFVRVSRRRPCPVCDHSNNCSVSQDGRVAYCRRVRGTKQGRDGGWVHILDATTTPQARVAPTTRQTPPDRASVDHLDAIHCKLLRECLTLTEGHRADLYRRGLTRVEIERLGFASTPTPEEGDQIARALADYDLRGVPGFYREGDQWRMTKCRSGFFVPYRNPKGQIAALQYRLDVPFDKTKYLWLSSANQPGGASSGAPVHFANRHLMRAAEEVLVTEGGLKADVIACLAQTGVIGVAGVSCFGADFAARLREDFPKVRRVVIAYDMDLIVKDEVFAALQRLARQLEQAAYQVRVRTWPAQYKGFDDYLLSQLAGQEVAA